MSAFDLWCNFKYLSLEKLLTRQPEGWLDIIPYHADARKVQIYWDEDGCWLQIEDKRVKKVDHWTAIRVMMALKRAAERQAESFAQDIIAVKEYYEDNTSPS